MNQIEQDEACNNYYRLVAFIMDIASPVIHNYVTSCILKGSTFENYLLKNVNTFVHSNFRYNQTCCLSKCNWKKSKNFQRLLRKEDFNKLFGFDKNKSAHTTCTNITGIDFCCCPYFPNSVAVSSLDISLTYSILKLCEDWTNRSNDRYQIEEIKKCRNQIFHMSDSKTVSTDEFEIVWNHLKYSVKKIANTISKEEKQRVKKQILDKKKMVRISEDDLKQHQLYRSYWRDKCLEFEVSM